MPYDDRCGCVFCVECKPGKPCSTCPGNCVVCTGILPQNVQSLDEKDLSKWNKVVNISDNLNFMIKSLSTEINMNDFFDKYKDILLLNISMLSARYYFSSR